MIRNTHATQPARRAVGVSRQRRGDRRRARASASSRRATATCTRATPSRSHILMKVETHNHPTAISPFPGAATGSGGEIRDEGATGRGAQAEGRPGRLLGVAPAHPRLRAAVGDATTASRRASPPRSRSCSKARSAPPRSTTNSAARTSSATSARSSERESGARDALRGYHKPIMIAGGLGNVAPQHVEKSDVPPGAHADRARRAGDADRPGRRRGLVASAAARARRISTSLRCSAATPRSSGARRK